MTLAVPRPPITNSLSATSNTSREPRPSIVMLTRDGSLFARDWRNIPYTLPNALVQLQAQYHHCGEAASKECLSAATFVRHRGRDDRRPPWLAAQKEIHRVPRRIRSLSLASSSVGSGAVSSECRWSFASRRTSCAHCAISAVMRCSAAAESIRAYNEPSFFLLP